MKRVKLFVPKQEIKIKRSKIISTWSTVHSFCPYCYGKKVDGRKAIFKMLLKSMSVNELLFTFFHFEITLHINV